MIHLLGADSTDSGSALRFTRSREAGQADALSREAKTAPARGAAGQCGQQAAALRPVAVGLRRVRMTTMAYSIACDAMIAISPATVHSRGAERDVIARLAQAQVPAILHWYTGYSPFRPRRLRTACGSRRRASRRRCKASPRSARTCVGRPVRCSAGCGPPRPVRSAIGDLSSCVRGRRLIAGYRARGALSSSCQRVLGR